MTISREEAQRALDLYTEHGSLKRATAGGKRMSTFHAHLQRARALGLTPSVPVAMDAAAHKTMAELTAQSNVALVQAQETIKKLQRELLKSQKQESEHDIIKGIVGTLTKQVSELEIPEFLLSVKDGYSAPGVPTLFLSDLHWAEVVNPAQINGVNEYNLEIAHARMKKCIETAIHLLRILSPEMNYPGIVCVLGGDMVSGNIHDELTATNEINTMPTVLDLFGILVGVIKILADTFGHVFLPCVSGNHGRDTHKIWNKDRTSTSFDWLLYQFLKKHFENDSRVTFQIPDGPDAQYRIYNHKYLLTHGDQFRGGDGLIGPLGPIMRGDHKKRSRNAQINMEYDTMIMGHWHQYIHHSRVIINGSLKGYDEYAFNNNFGFEVPQQALWITHPKHGQTYRAPVKLAATPEYNAEAAWVSVPQ